MGLRESLNMRSSIRDKSLQNDPVQQTSFQLQADDIGAVLESMPNERIASGLVNKDAEEHAATQGNQSLGYSETLNDREITI